MTAAARVGFDARMLGAGGIGRYIEGLLPELVTQAPGFDWVVFAQRRRVEQIRALTPSARLMICDAPYYRLREQTQLWWAYRRARLDLLHVPHYNRPLGYRGRTVVTVHDLIPLEFPAIHSDWRGRAYHRLLIRAAVRRAAAIITPARTTADAVIQRLGPACPVVPIPEGVAPRWFANGPAPQDRVTLQELALAAPYFLYVGQWRVHRDLPTALRALRLVRLQVPSARLVVAGDCDPRRPEIPALADELGTGAVRFLGAVPDAVLATLYRSAAAVLMPSLQEGFGLPLLEGMASGAPAICSDIPVLRETVGDVALRCPPGDEASFATAMVRVLDPQERVRWVTAGPRHAATFRWPAAAAQTLAVYRGVLEGAA
jgi:glycosyltransferase involved in cell wall biosynthesis